MHSLPDFPCFPLGLSWGIIIIRTRLLIRCGKENGWGFTEMTGDMGTYLASTPWRASRPSWVVEVGHPLLSAPLLLLGSGSSASPWTTLWEVIIFFIYRQCFTDVTNHRHHISETGFRVLIITQHFNIRRTKLWWHVGFSVTLLLPPFLGVWGRLAIFLDLGAILMREQKSLEHKCTALLKVVEWLAIIPWLDKTMPWPLVSAKGQVQSHYWWSRSCDPSMQHPLTAG